MSLVFVPLSRAPRGINKALLGSIIIGLAVCSIPVRSQPLGGQLPSVSWFVDHPRERQAVLEWCQQYPGPARTDNRCIAAWEANIAAAQREGNARVGNEIARNRGDTSRPDEARYWRLRPEERREYLAYCNRMSAADQARIWCRQAREGADQPPAVQERRVPPTVRRS